MFRFPKILVKVSCLQESLPPHPGDVVTQPKLPWQGKAVSLQVFSPLLNKFPQNSLYLLSTPRPPFSLSPSTNFWNFQDRSKNFPNTIRIYRNVESKATSAKCGSPVKPVQEGRNGPVHFMPNLICLTLNSSTNKILILTFPGGFQPEMRGVGHTAPRIRIIFAAGKSRRPQILRENYLSPAHQILLSLWTFYCCSGVTTQSQKYSLGFKKRSITNRECKNINHILQTGSQKEKGKSDIISPYITQENRVSIFF